MGYNPTWDLDRFFPGGSESPEFARFLEELQAGIEGFRAKVAQAPEGARAWVEMLEQMQDLAKRLRQAGAFVSCLNSQNMKDTHAKILSGRIGQISAGFGAAMTLMDSRLLAMGDEDWKALLAQPELKEVTYPLEERRRRAQEKMGPEREALVGDLSVDGYHAWGTLYNTIVGRLAIAVEENGKTLKLSAGQAANRMLSPDRAVRIETFRKWEEAWGEQSELIAAALNHLAGYRLNLYKHRGWESVLQEPLENNRMSQQTLDVMWEVIERNKEHLVAYLNRKAQLLGLEKLDWHDVDAPLGSAVQKVGYDEAAEFIIEHFHRFSPKMAEFTRQAFEKRWIEAEDRPGKRPGGFCTSFPVAKESRIFMTYAGNASNVATLAHELGHAYHQHIMNDLPQLAQGYAMNVAETASTFAEMIVADASLKAAQTREDRLALLADKIERAVAFFMNIHARFIFETGFYEERRKGLISADRLNKMMEDAQRKAFRDALGEYHPLFWASKLHFYSTGQPFYNWPYTFGYLFSAGVYARAIAEGPAFEEKYVNLLRDTGRLRVEDLASRHLGVDLTKPEFWQDAVNLAIKDIAEFMELTK